MLGAAARIDAKKTHIVPDNMFRCGTRPQKKSYLSTLYSSSKSSCLPFNEEWTKLARKNAQQLMEAMHSGPECIELLIQRLVKYKRYIRPAGQVPGRAQRHRFLYKLEPDHGQAPLPESRIVEFDVHQHLDIVHLQLLSVTVIQQQIIFKRRDAEKKVDRDLTPISRMKSGRRLPTSRSDAELIMNLAEAVSENLVSLGKFEPSRSLPQQGIVCEGRCPHRRQETEGDVDYNAAVTPITVSAKDDKEDAPLYSASRPVQDVTIGSGTINSEQDPEPTLSLSVTSHEYATSVNSSSMTDSQDRAPASEEDLSESFTVLGPTNSAEVPLRQRDPLPLGATPIQFSMRYIHRIGDIIGSLMGISRASFIPRPEAQEESDHIGLLTTFSEQIAAAGRQLAERERDPSDRVLGRPPSVSITINQWGSNYNFGGGATECNLGGRRNRLKPFHGDNRYPYD